MNYEKAYKEALERAKSKIENDKGHVLYEDDIKEIFPELAESEGEQIRKNLICFFKKEYGTNSNARFAGIEVKDIIAWLEKQDEQKSFWNERDEKNLNTIINVIHGGTHLAYENEIDWLKSIKDRVQPQPKQEWREEDEKMLTQVINEMEAIKSNSSTVFEKNIAQNKIDWLKTIKDRIKEE